LIKKGDIKMKKLMRILTLSLLSIFLVTGTAMATHIPGTALQGVLDGITVSPLGNSSVDVTTDYLLDTCDSYWSITGTGASATTMIVEMAGFAPNNIFGVYSGTDYVQLFAGAGVTGDQAFLSIKADGSVYVNLTDTGVDFAGNNFGYYLDSTFYGNGGLWHSDTSLNNDNEDHMYAYQGTNTDTVQLPDLAPGLWTNNEYVLAFEDLKATAPSDWDYTDMVVMVESVNPAPVPEPSTILLVGTGLLGMIAFGRKRFNKKT
jgi:hypothetical protein